MRKLIVIGLIGAVGCVLLLGGKWLYAGCQAKMRDNLIVNPLHSSSAKIQVLTTYFASNSARNIYRVYANVVEDSDGGSGHETFEIEDSFIDGNYRTADIFGELRSNEKSGRIFEVRLRGERSGVVGGGGKGSFRQIHGATMLEQEK